MDWVSLVSAIGVSSIITTIVGVIQYRRINNATADNSNADYTAKIIEQAEARVKQALGDRDRAIKERDEAYVEAKGQRKAKQEWRDKFLQEQSDHNVTRFELKDSQAKVAEADWHRCELNGCQKRTPPRKRNDNVQSNCK